MNDDFLSRLAEPPRPEFAERLAERLRAIDEAREEASQPGRFRRLVPALAGAGLVAALAVAFTLDPVRAAARDFLDLFRVKRFAAVPVDGERLARLQQGLDLKSLVGEQVEVLVPPEKPVPVSSFEAGALEAGIEARQPAALPKGYEPGEVAISRPGSFRVRLDAPRLEQLAQAVGADEIEIPAGWNGARIDVDMPPVLLTQYQRPGDSDPRRRYVLMQSRNPEIALPEGVDPRTLGQLALRVAGLSAQDALRFSRSVDWRATLLVPVPAGSGGTYREVEVNGVSGLLVSARPGREPRRDGVPRGPHSVLLLATADGVYAMHGPGADGVELLAMAQSVR